MLNFERGLSIDQCLKRMTLVLNDGCPHRRPWKNSKGEILPWRVNEDNVTDVRKMLDEGRLAT